MEDYLGMIDGVPSKGKRLTLRNNGIKTRYYSIDKEGHSTHSNAQMAALAIEKLADDAFKIEDIELLACGTASPDKPHAIACSYGSWRIEARATFRINFSIWLLLCEYAIFKNWLLVYFSR
jgi:hypothetical protein